MDANLYNGLTLAYMGDAIYELYVRKYALSLGFMKVNELHQKVTCYTNALAQAQTIHYYLEQNLLTEEEVSIFKRGRNSHIHTKRKNVDLASYLDATGFEALLGYLYLKNEIIRLEELIEISLNRN
ncbi:MAG: ribonuclease III [Roseburia sp.]|nr:ribonuclease III [Anaeroplasma bactoclasticum]MCM1195680.1 ribonuclease III [Roseburia sp.]MCM1556137.1 ribonuclease III [Anaeroplasma bactoclasticum]